MGFVEQVDNFIARVDDFIERVERLYEVDYGDFKRKIGQYILRLEQSLGPSSKPEARAILRDMRLRLIYQPHPDIEVGRDTAITLARKLRTVAGGG